MATPQQSVAGQCLLQILCMHHDNIAGMYLATAVGQIKQCFPVVSTVQKLLELFAQRGLNVQHALHPLLASCTPCGLVWILHMHTN